MDGHYEPIPQANPAAAPPPPPQAQSPANQYEPIGQPMDMQNYQPLVPAAGLGPPPGVAPTPPGMLHTPGYQPMAAVNQPFLYQPMGVGALPPPPPMLVEPPPPPDAHMPNRANGANIYVSPPPVQAAPQERIGGYVLPPAVEKSAEDESDSKSRSASQPAPPPPPPARKPSNVKKKVSHVKRPSKLKEQKTKKDKKDRDKDKEKDKEKEREKEKPRDKKKKEEEDGEGKTYDAKTEKDKKDRDKEREKERAKEKEREKEKQKARKKVSKAKEPTVVPTEDSSLKSEDPSAKRTTTTRVPSKPKKSTSRGRSHDRSKKGSPMCAGIWMLVIMLGSVLTSGGLVAVAFGRDTFMNMNVK